MKILKNNLRFEVFKSKFINYYQSSSERNSAPSKETIIKRRKEARKENERKKMEIKEKQENERNKRFFEFATNFLQQEGSEKKLLESFNSHEHNIFISERKKKKFEEEVNNIRAKFTSNRNLNEAIKESFQSIDNSFSDKEKFGFIDKALLELKTVADIESSPKEISKVLKLLVFDLIGNK